MFKEVLERDGKPRKVRNSSLHTERENIQEGITGGKIKSFSHSCISCLWLLGKRMNENNVVRHRWEELGILHLPGSLHCPQSVI
jgi:hypothetical protein